MVVPLKLTQFYGHSVPRPRIYADVKFNEHRVDPPPSVNDALLSWAADAHWSMGGLSFKRLRAQGKLEGSVRRLRAQLEEEDEDEAAGTKGHGGAVKTKTVTKKKAGTSDGMEKRKRGEEAVEVTPAKKLRVKEGNGNDGGRDWPGFVPATQDKKESKVSSTSASKQKKKGAQSPTPAKVTETPSFVPSTEERRISKRSALSGRTSGGSKSPVSGGRISPAEAGRLTRSAKKKPLDQADQMATAASPEQKSKRGRPAVRKILLSDGSDSDDGLEVFLKQKNRPLRRSGRLGKESPTNLQHDSSGSDSESA